MWHLPTKSGLMRSFLKANELDQIFLKRKKGFFEDIFLLRTLGHCVKCSVPN